MKSVKAVIFAVLVILLSLSVGKTFAQERPIHEVYSMMVFNFSKYVQWPENEDGEFVIGVIGNEDVYKTLNTWYSGKPKGNKKFVIKNYKNASEVEDCQILYIDKSKSGEFETANAKVKGKGTLVVTDRNGLGSKGSCINFKTIDNKLKFELNQQAIASSNLKVSSALTTMAILI
jgi:YfiR/HmsC-like